MRGRSKLEWETADEKTKEYIASEEREVKKSKIRSFCGIVLFFGISVFVLIMIVSGTELSNYKMSVTPRVPIYDYRTDYRIIERDRKAREAETQRLVATKREELTTKYVAICVPHRAWVCRNCAYLCGDSQQKI